MYSTDLAYVHDAGFGGFADRAAPELIRILRRHGIRRGRVVDVGCGSGPLARRLVDAGYDVVGIDRSPAMIRLARAKVPEARFRVASITAAKIPRAVAVVALNEVVSYVPEPKRRLTKLRTFFAHVHEALEPGGLLIFDFIASAERRTYAGKSRSGPDWAIAARADVDRAGRVLTRHITTFRKLRGEYRKSTETHRVRIYGRDAMADALTDAGFRVKMRRSYGCLRLLPGDFAAIAEKLTAFRSVPKRAAPK